MSTAARCMRLLAPALIAVGLLAPAAAHARRPARRVSLSLPTSALAGSRVHASGRVGARSRGRRVVLQARSGRRWRTLGAAAVSHGRFKVTFLAPSQPGVLIVRAAVYRRRHLLRTSRSRSLRIYLPVAHAHGPPPALGESIAAWGDNDHRQLGGGFKSALSATPIFVRGLSGIEAVATTYFSSYALLSDGTVRSWGGNLVGQLGNGTRGESSQSPVPVTNLFGVRAIAAGGAHAMALLGNGTVVTWGGNGYGELGNGTTQHANELAGSGTPVLVPGLSNVVAIAAGGGDDAALLANGTLMAWGENKNGQLGDGTKTEKDVPTPVRGLTGVKAVAIGGVPSLGGHMLVLLDDGTVRAIGANGSGQLGNGTTITSFSPVPVAGLSAVKAVAADVSHSMALLENGQVMAWGSNTYGQLGRPSGPEKCEANSCSRVPIPVGVPSASAISAGFRFSLALSGGSVYAWGVNEFGQLGDGSTTASSTPKAVSGLSNAVAISAGEKHSLAIVREAAPAPLIEVTPGVGSLTVTWRADPTAENWNVSWRPVSHPQAKWGPFVTLPPATRSYTITGLQPVPYQVLVKNKTAGVKIVNGTPLG